MKNNPIIKVIWVLLITFTALSCQRKDNFSDVDSMVAEAMKSSETITVEQLKALIDNGEMLLLIDVREPAEHNAGYIPGSLNIPRGTLEFKIGNADFWDEAMLYMPEKDEPIVVYCKKGKRSILAAQTLHRLGYKNVRYLDEGWKKWEMTYPLIYEKNLDKVPHNEGVEVGGC